jgi:UDP-N-acetylglucosamine 2-epimerase
MNRLKVTTIVGTRPEIIRLSRVMSKLDELCDHTLVHTGQNYDYELNQIFFEDLALRKPDHFLNAAGANATETIGNIIKCADQVLSEIRPEAVLVLGDTNSCLALLAAKRRKIPTFHMEAGNRCFDQRVPEEINRRIVDHLADVNLTYSSIAREYLLREGLPPDLVIKTGSPMSEVLMHYLPRIESSTVMEHLGLKAGQFFVVSAHREENIDSEKSFLDLIDVLNSVAKEYGYPVIVSTHPRTKKRVDSAGVTFDPLVRLLKPMKFTDFVNLEINAKATLSDSGTITEESSILNFPALNIRQAHERPEGMENASVMLTGLSVVRVLQGLEILCSQPRGKERLLLPVADYSVPNVSDKVVRLILSYTDYINRVVWHKSF